MLILPNGAGELLGDSLAVNPLQLPGNVWWVLSTIGIDGASPAGKDREKPLATLAQAITNAAANDLIVLRAGHVETVAAGININKALTIVGGGSNAGVPSVTYTSSAANNTVFNISAANVEMRNIKVNASAVSNTGGGNGKIFVTGASCELNRIYVEQSGNDQMPAGISLFTGASGARLINCTIVSTATLLATRPPVGLQITAALTDIRLDGLTLSDGTVGFSTSALDSGTITRLRIENLSLLLGADFVTNAATTGYRGGVTTITGGGRIQW
jgi:hypothetical protein